MSELKDYAVQEIQDLISRHRNRFDQSGLVLEALKELVRIDEVDQAIEAYEAAKRDQVL